MNFDFSRSMQNMTDAELIKVLTTDRNDYQQPALIAAENELKKRNLSNEQVESVKS